MKKGLLIFVSGLAFGSVLGYLIKLGKKKEEANKPKIVEIHRYHDSSYDISEKESEDPEVTPEDKEEYEVVINAMNYSSISRKGGESTVKKKEPDYDIMPYVIPPEKFGEFDQDYDIVSLTYFEKDDILADEYYNVIDNDREDLLGPDALNSFGKYEEDTVYVRDDTNKIDYEVIRDSGSYTEEVSLILKKGETNDESST